MAGGAGQIAWRWTLQPCWVPSGAQQQNVPVAQSLLQNNDFAANGGLVYMTGNPIGSDVDTALNTVVANMKAAFDTGTNLAVLQGWQNGTG